MPKLIVRLPDDRSRTGTLEFLDDTGDIISGPFHAGGQAARDSANAHGNPGRSPLLPYGHTPLGAYVISGFQQASSAEDIRRHGALGKMKIEPVSGEAKLAKDAGRRYLQIHGGDLRADGALRPTNGCVRLSNDDMASLVLAIQLRGASLDSCEVIRLEVVSLDSKEIPQNGDDGDNDPPDDSPIRPIP